MAEPSDAQPVEICSFPPSLIELFCVMWSNNPMFSPLTFGTSLFSSPPPGEHVRCIQGAQAGLSGMIVFTEGDKCTLFADVTREEVCLVLVLHGYRGEMSKH